MSTHIDPTDFGLPKRTVIERLSEQSYALVVDRKSRIIMKDGKKIIEKANKIKMKMPDCQLTLKTSAPVCSKTVRLLEENSIDIIIL